jgi:hypothetical protein
MRLRLKPLRQPVKTSVQRCKPAAEADCLTAAEDAYLRPCIDDGDLLSLLQAERKLLATKVSNGQMSKEEADLEMTQVMTAIHSEAAQRANTASIAAAQRSAASAHCHL